MRACGCMYVHVRVCVSYPKDSYTYMCICHIIHSSPLLPLPLLSPSTGMNWRGYSWKTSSSTSMSPPAPTPSSTLTCVPWQRRTGYCFLRSTFPLLETGPQRLRYAQVLPVHGRCTSLCNGSRSVGNVEHGNLFSETLIRGLYVVCGCDAPVYCLQGLVVKCARVCLLYVCVCTCVIVVCL